MSFINSSFLNNTFDKGSLFNFAHNFKQTVFLGCTIQNNNGYLLEMVPFNTQNIDIVQAVDIINCTFLMNQGRNYGLLHVTTNANLNIF